MDPAAAATCQVIAAALPVLEARARTSEIATALLTGIVRDSHGFSDPSTTGETLRIAAELVDAGAPLALIQRRVLADLPFATLALWGLMLRELGSAREGRIIYTTLRPDMLEATGTENSDADGLAEFIARAAMRTSRSSCARWGRPDAGEPAGQRRGGCDTDRR